MAALLSIKSPSMETIESGYPTEFSSNTNLYQQNGGSNGNNNGSRKYGVSNPALELDSDVDMGKKGALTSVDMGPPHYPDQEKENPNKKEIPALPDPEKPGCFKQYGGMLLTLAASFLFSLVLVIVKQLQAYDFGSEDSSFWRYLGIFAPSVPLLFYFECKQQSNNKKGIKSKTGKLGNSVFDTVWPMTNKENMKTVIGLLTRGFLGSSSVILRYFAVEYLTIGDASVISYSSPILVTILAHFFLGEKTGWIPVFTCFLAIGGVMVITQPPVLTGRDSFDEKTLIGTGFALGSLVCSAVMTIITRKIRKVQFSLMLVIFGIIGMIQSYVISQFLTGFSFPTGTIDSIMIFGVAALSFVGQMSIILALKFEQAGPVSLIRTCDVVFSFIFQFFFFGITPNVFSAIGGSVVFFGVFVTALRKYISTLPTENGFRRMLRFLLF